MARHPFKIDAFVLLPDHLHCVWTLPEGDSLFYALEVDQERLYPRVWRDLSGKHLSITAAEGGTSG